MCDMHELLFIMLKQTAELHRDIGSQFTGHRHCSHQHKMVTRPQKNWPHCHKQRPYYLTHRKNTSSQKCRLIIMHTNCGYITKESTRKVYIVKWTDFGPKTRVNSKHAHPYQYHDTRRYYHSRHLTLHDAMSHFFHHMSLHTHCEVDPVIVCPNLMLDQCFTCTLCIYKCTNPEWTQNHRWLYHKWWEEFKNNSQF